MVKVAEATGDLEAIIARTALKYDLLPYESKPFAQSQPARLGALARLFGLEAAPMENARVLELGCASGGNIIPHAALYPNATFVGVDLARTQVAAGRARIERMGLDNVEILCKSFTEIGEELGAFDYIICHGVYSWVPPQVQDAIMRVVRARLSPVGVACISYNVHPGWRMMQPLRDALQLGVPDSVDSLGRVAIAREMLTFLSANSPDKGPYGDTLRNWAGRLATLPDDYIAHEFLEECNAPCLLTDFTGSAARHGLGYLGECELSGMIIDNYGSELAAGIRARGGNDLVASEQWLDLLTGRTFRQTLLIANERMGGVNRNLTPQAMENLHLVLPVGASFQRDGDKAGFTYADGRSINTEVGAVAAMMEVMAKRYPATTCLAELLGDGDATASEQIRETAYRMAMTGLVHLNSEPVVCATQAGDMPKAIAVARADAKAGITTTTSLRHETVALDAAAQVLLPYLDGKTGHKALEAHLQEASKLGKLSYARSGQPITDPKELKTTISEHLPALLAGIAATALLEASKDSR